MKLFFYMTLYKVKRPLEKMTFINLGTPAAVGVPPTASLNNKFPKDNFILLHQNYHTEFLTGTTFL